MFCMSQLCSKASYKNKTKKTKTFSPFNLSDLVYFIFMLTATATSMVLTRSYYPLLVCLCWQQQFTLTMDWIYWIYLKKRSKERFHISFKVNCTLCTVDLSTWGFLFFPKEVQNSSARLYTNLARQDHISLNYALLSKLVHSVPSKKKRIVIYHYLKLQ